MTSGVVVTLAVQQLRFAYPRGGEELFSGLSHDFATGALTAITGPSGRGKSTLLYMLGLLLTPTEGHVLLDGTPVSAASDRVRAELRARRIGFVFQDSELDPTRKVIDSVLEPALYAGWSRAERLADARDLLTAFGLGNRAEHRPGQVSGGQAQRLAVCRALLNRPSVMLADEPTGNLDHGNATLVLDALVEAAHARGSTVVIATHDPFVLSRVDEVIDL